MIRKIYASLLAIAFFSAPAYTQSLNNGPNASLGQPQPFLFTVNTLNPSGRSWSLNYSGGYGERTVTPLGYNGVDQNFTVKGYLGSRVTMLISAGIGFGKDGQVGSLQQAEFLRDFIGGNSPTDLRIGASLGFRREFDNSKVALTRITAAYDKLNWKLGANVRFEKAFATGRDGVDIISSIGVHRKISNQFFGGLEAIGQDLEGFWETDEAEGGARLLIGPSLNYAPVSSRLSFTLCGGPIIYATRSTSTTAAFPVRELPITNGFTMKFNIGFKF